MPKAKQVKRSQGRPKAIIDWDKVGKMCEAGGFARGIAATLGITEDTLGNRCKSDLKLDFSEFRQQKLARGDELLKSKQFQVAMTGDKTMLIWLGKQRLGQSEKNELKADFEITTRTIEPE